MQNDVLHAQLRRATKEWIDLSASGTAWGEASKNKGAQLLGVEILKNVYDTYHIISLDTTYVPYVPPPGYKLIWKHIELWRCPPNWSS